MYGGAKGGGKTDWLLFDFCHPYLLNKPNYRGIIFRRTYPRLREIIDRSHYWFTGMAIYNSQDRCWTFKSGAKLYFAHCQYEEDKYDYQGQQFHYMGFDQLEEFTLTQYNFLKAQIRSVDKEIPVRVRATANPGNIGHTWVKSRFIDNKEPYAIYKDQEGITSIFIPAKVYDNPTLLANDPGYINRLKSLPEKERQALLDGDWNVFSGQFFNEWNKKIHTIPAIDLSQINHRKFIALDYGFSKPSSVGWYSILPEGSLIRFKEFYSEGYTYEDLAYKVLELNGKDEVEYLVADPAIFGDKSHHTTQQNNDGKEFKGESGAETMQKVFGSHIHIMRGDNTRIIGWGRFREYLAPYRNQHNDVVAKLQVTSNCKNFIRTIPGLIHDERNEEDIDTAGEDHPADECRYAIMSRPTLPSIKKQTLTPNEEFWQRVEKDKRDFEQARIGESGEIEIESEEAIGI